MNRLLPTILGMSLAFWGCSGPDGDLPRRYREVEVPVARLESAAAQERGRRRFLVHCALCHGERADGRGVRREGLSTSPRDFTDPSWRRQTSPRRVYFAIREGVPGTAMPSWKALEEEESWDLVSYLLSVADSHR
jgi:mono/diheme cytochrome c family protein